MSNQTVDIVPAILEEDFAEIKNKYEVASGLVSMVQVDVCDGDFVPSKTFGAVAKEEDFERLKELAEKNNLEIELDMMVNLDAHIRDGFAKWLTAVRVSGAKKVVFHYGSTTRWYELFQALDGKGIEIGLGVHLDTDMQKVVSLLKKYNFGYVQIMGIEKVGFGGQHFSDKTPDKIKELFQEFPFLPISIDGGVNFESAPILIKAGITTLTAGSAIFKSDNPQKAIDKLKGEC